MAERFIVDTRDVGKHGAITAIIDTKLGRFATYSNPGRAHARSAILNEDPRTGRHLVWRLESTPDVPGRHYLEEED